MPFSLLATAYRRKRILEGLIGGDKVMTAQIAQMAEEEGAAAKEGEQTAQGEWE